MVTRQPIRTIRNQVYDILKDQICSGVYPPGSWLQEQELATALNVSRSPIREALRQLVSDGLADELPNKGVFVRQVTAKSIDDIFEMRVLLETYSIGRRGQLADKPSKESLRCLQAQMQQAHTNSDVAAYTQLDDQLHLLIVQQCGNRLVEETYVRVHSMIQQFRIYSLVAQTRFCASLAEHESLIGALLDDALDDAIRINTAHLEAAHKQILSDLTRQDGDSLPRT